MEFALFILSVIQIISVVASFFFFYKFVREKRLRSFADYKLQLIIDEYHKMLQYSVSFDETKNVRTNRALMTLINKPIIPLSGTTDGKI